MTTQHRTLSGRHAVVCGGSRGIGAATATTLAQLGASVTLLARNEGQLRDAVAALPGSDGPGHDYIAVDMRDTAALATAIAGRAGQPCEILINNSGGPPPGPLEEASVEALLDAFHQHLLAAHTLTRAFVPQMRAAGYGRIVNVISTSVKEPIPGLGVSNTVRGAMASWSKTLARELGPAGITVNNVLPGFTSTERLVTFFGDIAARTGRTPEQVRADKHTEVPVGRFAEPHEIAAAVAFLASPAAAYVNGINLPVDGGRTRSL